MEKLVFGWEMAPIESELSASCLDFFSEACKDIPTKAQRLQRATRNADLEG
jgi:hypothetical protein